MSYESRPRQRRAGVAIIAAIGLWSICFTGTAVAQQAYPTKPIRFIVPYAPGSATSAVARPIAQKLAEGLGQSVFVDERGGGNTVIGTEALVRSSPDGYTILMVATTHVIVPLLVATPYDPIKDFTPVGTVASSELALVVNSAVPANTVQEFIALAKSKPGQLNYATGGTGTTTHLASELFNMIAGIRTQHIAYKGAGPAMTDLVGGQVQLYFGAPISILPHVKSGKVRALAVSGQSRSPALPQVPTFAEAGMPGVDTGLWFGILAPANTPKPIVDRLSAELTKILAQADVKTSLSGQGMDPLVSSPEKFAELIRADAAKFAKVVKAANIKAE